MASTVGKVRETLCFAQETLISFQNLRDRPDTCLVLNTGINYN